MPWGLLGGAVYRLERGRLMLEDHVLEALAVCVCGCVVSYFAIPWFDRAYSRWRNRRIAKWVERTQKNRWD